jgi:dimethylglycine dehydrogenase
MAVGPCAEAIVVRVSFTGELGYEIYMPAEYQRGLYDELVAQGRPFDLRHTGSRALLSMRVEKGFPSWGPDLTADYSPYEPGMGRFVRLEKPDFIGKSEAESKAKAGPSERFTSFVVETDDVDCFGGEAIWRDGELAGYVTSGSYGHRIQESVALGYIKPRFYEDGAKFEVEVLGERRPARMSARPCYDPDGGLMRR